MKIAIQKSDLTILENAGIIKSVLIDTAWNRLREKCPIVPADNNQTAVVVKKTKTEALPSLEGTFDEIESLKYDIAVTYSLQNGYQVARDITRELQTKGYSVCLTTEGSFDPQDTEKKIAKSTALLVVLTQDCLKQNEVVFAMTAAKLYFNHPSLVILVHDAGSCFFPGYDEQPDHLKEFFSEKAVTFLSCYTKEGIKEIASKFESEKLALNNAIAASKENPKNALLQYLSKKEDQKEVSYREIKRRMRGIYPEQELHEILATADVNKDGVLDGSEFEALYEKLQREAESSSQEEVHEDLTTRIFLSHKRSTGQGIAGRLYEGLKGDYRCFIDSEAKFKIHNLRQIVESTQVLIFILSHGILQSKWCLEELKSALDYKKKVIVVRELSYTLPAELPHEWLCVEDVIRTPDVLVWIAEYNAACLEALKKKIGPSDEIQRLTANYKPPQEWVDLTHKKYQETGNLDIFHELMLYTVPYSLTEIKELRLIKHGVSPPQSFGPEDIKYIALHMPNLEVLECLFAGRLSAKSLEPLAQNCPKLRRLKLPAAKMTDVNLLKDMAKCWPNLEYLNLAKCGLYASNIAAEFNNLKHLILRDNWQLNNPINGWGHLPLETLDLTMCNRLDDTAAKFIGANFKNLTVLSVGNFLKMTEEGLQALTEGAFNLRVLVLSSCTELTDNSMDLVTQRWPDLEHLELKELSDLTDKSMKFLGERCPKITHLNLNGCKGITDEGLKLMFAGCPQLSYLHLGTTGTTEKATQYLADHNIHLQMLFLVSDKMGDATIQNLAPVGNTIVRIEMQNCPNITDAAWKNIASIIPNVRELSIFNCPLVTQKSVPEWKCLNRLNAFFIMGFPYEDFKEVPGACNGPFLPDPVFYTI